MKAMHDALVEFLSEDVPIRVAADLFERKLSLQGVTLSESQRSSLETAIRPMLAGHSVDSIELEGIPANLQICIDPDDVSSLEKSLDELKGSLPRVISETVEEESVALRKDLNARWETEKEGRESARQGFEARLEERWREPFSQFRQLLLMAREVGESINNRLRRESSIGANIVDVQTRLHARGCQIAGEVMTLMAAGYAEGAMARWRSLHEIAVTSMFIGSDDSLAERYRLHQHVDSLKAARLHNQHAERLGQETITAETLTSLETTIKDLKQRFGDPFAQDYGWAAEELKNPNPKLEQIESSVRVGHLRPYYKLASHSVHAKAKGAYYRLGLVDSLRSNLLLAGPSNYGLADPGQSAAISLCHLTAALIMLDPTLDTLVVMRILLAMSTDIGHRFAECQRAVEEAERERLRNE